MNFNVDEYVILETVTGSRLYGTELPDSDFDYKGVCLVPFRILLSPFQNFEQHIETKNKDRTIYGLNKFFRLAYDCNPTIIEILFAPKEKRITWNEKGLELIYRRDLFLSKKATKTFIGYAESQLKRIRTHREWLLNPPKKKPIREDFNLPNQPKFSYLQLTNIIHSPIEVIKEEYKEEALKEISYRSAKDYWDKYENWRNTRNPKRAELEKICGYDPKHAMHLFRLLEEGVEVLTNKTITLPRPNAKELLEIRNGKYSYDTLMRIVEEKKQLVYKAEKDSDLPKSPDVNSLTDLYLFLLI